MCEMQFTVFNLEGKELFKNTVSQLIKGNEAEKICDTRLKKELSGKNYFIRFDWKNSKGEQKTRTFSNLTSAYKKADSADVSIKIKSVSAESKTAIITIENKKYVRNCWLYSKVIGVKFDSNFNDLLPGIHEFEIKFIDIPKDKDFELKWM
jgi:formyltetrahydrofolate hydrolase